MKYKFLFLGLALSYSALQALPTQPVLTPEVALKMTQNAFEKCKSEGYKVSVNVLDRAGNQVAFVRDENAGPHTIQGSYRKSFTALSTKTPTSEYQTKLAKKQIPEGMTNLNKNFVFVAGGVPIKVGNIVIGGIGISGAPSGDLDEKCALAGIESVKKDLK